MMADEFLTGFGGAVKSLGRNRVGGRVVTFSTHADPDRVRDFFDENTDFWLSGPGETRPILYRHGLDRILKRRRFGSVELTKASDGIWAEGTIKGADEHSHKLLEMVGADQMKWSTGSVGHLVNKTPRAGAFHIDEWPISECSLVPNDLVAEPRCVATLKSLVAADAPDFELLTRVNSAEQRAREIYVQTVIDRYQRVMREVERSQLSDSRAEETDYYSAMANLANAKCELRRSQLEKMKR